MLNRGLSDLDKTNHPDSLSTGPAQTLRTQPDTMDIRNVTWIASQWIWWRFHQITSISTRPD